MDRTCLNLISAILGGAGLLTVLTGFNVPQVRMSFYGENPYQIKRDAISDVMTWLFTALALTGLVIQATAEIAGDALPERLYSTWSYVRVAAGTTASGAILVWLLTRAGRLLARRRWLPTVLDKHKEMMQRARFAVDHDGMFVEHHAEKDRFTEEQNTLTSENDLAEVDAHLAQLEDLRELSVIEGRAERMRRLESFYSATPRLTGA